MIHKITFLLLLVSSIIFGQSPRIHIVNADQTYSDQVKQPDALVLNGNVILSHKGAIMTCQKAILFQSENKVYAFGDVVIKQGDTLTQKSQHVQYNANTLKAKSWGKVYLKDKENLLTTDTLYFDRGKQQMFYQCNGRIQNPQSNLTSKRGTYFANTKVFKAQENVLLTTIKSKLKTQDLEYHTLTGISFLKGPSHIKNEESTMYTEKGEYNSKLNTGTFVEKSKITYQNRLITGDTLFYDKIKEFARGKGNLVITDTINKLMVKGNYGEVYKKKDSVYVTKKPVIISYEKQDTTYIHGEKLIMYGKPNERKTKIYHKVKIFKNDMAGKCDSLFVDEKLGITQMFKLPVLWSDKNQITGDTITLFRNLKTKQLDSLMVYKNAFIVQKDSIGYNQIKGKTLDGTFLNGKLKHITVKGNGAVVNYARETDQTLTGITKIDCSDLLFDFEDGKMETIQFMSKPDGDTYPPFLFPEHLQKLPGFIWRENERPLIPSDIFKHD